LPTVTD
jgi:hypothetical protein